MYKLFIPLASDYVIQLYNLAIKNPSQVLKQQPQANVFRYVVYEDLIKKGTFHKIEEYRHPGIGYEHLTKDEGSSEMKKHKIYPLDQWIIKKIFSNYFESFAMKQG